MNEIHSKRQINTVHPKATSDCFSHARGCVADALILCRMSKTGVFKPLARPTSASDNNLALFTIWHRCRDTDWVIAAALIPVSRNSHSVAATGTERSSACVGKATHAAINTWKHLIKASV